MTSDPGFRKEGGKLVPMTEVLTEFPIYLTEDLGEKTPCPLCIDPSRLVVGVLSAPYILLTSLLFLMNLILYICHNKKGFKPHITEPS